MKRSRHIKLVLLGSLSAGILSGCDSGSGPPVVSSTLVYTNNHYVPGVGYYHAPYQAFFEHPYNLFNAQTKQYYHGGQWTSLPCLSITNLSSPSAALAAQTESRRTDIPRGGFGRSSSHHSIWS